MAFCSTTKPDSNRVLLIFSTFFTGPAFFSLSGLHEERRGDIEDQGEREGLDHSLSPFDLLSSLSPCNSQRQMGVKVPWTIDSYFTTKQ